MDSNNRIYGWGLWEFLVFFIIFVIIIIVLVQWVYNRRLFAPSASMEPLGDDYNYEDLYIGTKSELVHKTKTKTKSANEESLNVWFFHNYPQAKVLLFYHGNSGNISNRSYVVDICKAFKLNLLLVDYRGYGNSDGSPNIGTLPEDGEIAYRFLRKIFPAKDIIIWGESLGGAVAVYTAARNECRCLILLSTFSSLSDVVEHYQGINGMPRGALKGFMALTQNELNSKHWIRSVKAPVLQIHSKEDELIAFESAKSLFNNIESHKQFMTIGGSHSSPIISSQQLEDVFNFIGIRKRGDLKELSQKLEKVAKDYRWV